MLVLKLSSLIRLSIIRFLESGALFVLSLFIYKWEPKMDSRIEAFWNVRVIYCVEDWRQAISLGSRFHNQVRPVSLPFAKWRAPQKRTHMSQQRPVTNIRKPGPSPSWSTHIFKPNQLIHLKIITSDGFLIIHQIRYYFIVSNFLKDFFLASSYHYWFIGALFSPPQSPGPWLMPLLSHLVHSAFC